MGISFEAFLLVTVHFAHVLCLIHLVTEPSAFLSFLFFLFVLFYFVHLFSWLVFSYPASGGLDLRSTQQAGHCDAITAPE